MEKCARCGKELLCVSNNARYCKQCRKEVDDELYKRQYERQKVLRQNYVLWLFEEAKINIKWLCSHLWLGSNTLYSKLNQWLDLTLQQKVKTSEWLDEKIRLLIKYKLRLDKQIDRAIEEDIDEDDF